MTIAWARLRGPRELPAAAARFRSNVAGALAHLVRPPRVGGGRCTLLPAPLVPFAVAAGIVALAALAAMTFVDDWAAALARRLPLGVVSFFNVVTDFGKSGWILVPAGAFLLVAAACASDALGRITNRVLAALAVRVGFVFLAVGIPGLLVAIGKRLIGRVRPSDLGPFAYEPWSWQASYASLPSGHTTTAFAAAVAIGLVWPRARTIVWTCAALIGISRVVVGAHYPSDVLAGAAVGVLGALVVRNWFALRRLGFAVSGDGSVRPMPGPSSRRLGIVLRRLWQKPAALASRLSTFVISPPYALAPPHRKVPSMSAPYPVTAVANAILEKAFADRRPVCPLKLQKLIYYAHGYYSAVARRPLIDQAFEAWPYGPVVPAAYEAFREFGGRPINRLATDYDRAFGAHIPVLDLMDDANARRAIDYVWQRYGDLPALTLSEMAHRPGSPWDATMKENPFGLRNLGIPQERIETYFARLVRTTA